MCGRVPQTIRRTNQCVIQRCACTAHIMKLTRVGFACTQATIANNAHANADTCLLGGGRVLWFAWAQSFGELAKPRFVNRPPLSEPVRVSRVGGRSTAARPRFYAPASLLGMLPVIGRTARGSIRRKCRLHTPQATGCSAHLPPLN